ncbi:hypothetical protein GCM10010472_64210 [Pseudonocardia halophobica]|uniref:Uncharacterized protein n=1 Tax=Pseudonocardia halophobica TaxID=29401 RepID=A0A9W6P0A5_9PSEU|nr:hypothetical protein [Pseudonocardia halophobica]GLL15491.1 hypothetical protein GCM10017577_66420 [Pseudonocardia halophobica]
MDEWHGGRDPRPAADRRDVAACARDDAAGVRDEVSRERDAEADLRDIRARTRDAEVVGRSQQVVGRLRDLRRSLLESLDRLERDGAAPVGSAEAWRRDRAAVSLLLEEAIMIVARDESLRRNAAGDRRASARDRCAAARDRRESAGDREDAAADREQSALEREQLGRAEADAVRRRTEEARDRTVVTAAAVSRAVRGSRLQVAESRDVLARVRARRSRRAP